MDVTVSGIASSRNSIGWGQLDSKELKAQSYGHLLKSNINENLKLDNSMLNVGWTAIDGKSSPGRVEGANWGDWSRVSRMWHCLVLSWKVRDASFQILSHVCSYSLFNAYPYDIPTECFTKETFRQAFAAIQATVVHLQNVPLSRRFALVPLGPPLMTYSSTSKVLRHWSVRFISSLGVAENEWRWKERWIDGGSALPWRRAHLCLVWSTAKSAFID